MPAPNIIPYDTQQSIVKELDPRKEINNIVERLLGIYTVTEQDSGKTKVEQRRLSQPFFTEEFVSNLKFLLYSYLNNINAYTKYSEEEINAVIRNISLSLHDLFAIKGNDEYVSQKTWLSILKVHDSGDFIQGNVKSQKVSGWQEFGIDWDYNKPVTNEMVGLVKDYDEQEDQSVIFDNFSGAIRRLIRSVYNRSVAMPNGVGMMLDALTSTRRESFNDSVQPYAQMPPMAGVQNTQ